jgi:hypothetical protein
MAILSGNWEFGTHAYIMQIVLLTFNSILQGLKSPFNFRHQILVHSMCSSVAVISTDKSRVLALSNCRPTCLFQCCFKLLN